MSEPTTDLDWWAATRYPSVHDDWHPTSTSTGRHAINEVAAETPIFHALSTGAWRTREPAVPAARPASPARGAQRRTPHDRGLDRGRGHDRGDRPTRDGRGTRATGRHELVAPAQQGHDPVEAFRRDPLTMPIPMPIPVQSAAASTAAARRAAFGAHALQSERAQAERPRVPEPARPERGRSQNRHRDAEYRDRPDRRDRAEHRGHPGYADQRDAVTDSGRHHRRRPPISTLL